MKIQQIQNRDITFQTLHLDNKVTNKYCASFFLNNQNIKKCADKFDALICHGKQYQKNNALQAQREKFKLLTGMLCGGVGAIGATLACSIGTGGIGALLIPLCASSSYLMGYVVASCSPFYKNDNKDSQFNNKNNENNSGRVDFHNVFSKTFLLPLKVTQGSVKEREAKSDEYFNHFLNEFISQKECNTNTYINSIHKALGNKKIKCYVNNSESTITGSLKNIVMGDINDKNAYYYGYEIQLGQDSKGNILNKSTAIHEARHLFDRLFNPKYSVLRADARANSVEELSSFIVDTQTFFHNKKSFNKTLNELTKNLPDDVAINTLQLSRYNLKSERNAYKSELRFVKGMNVFKNLLSIINSLCAIQVYHFDEREKAVEVKLLQLLKKVREEIKQGS